MNDKKRWWQSKTFWFNAVTILTAVVAYYGWAPNEAMAGQIKDALFAFSPVVNLILRFVTKKPLG